MASQSPPAAKRAFRHAIAPVPPHRGEARPSRGMFLKGLRGTLLVVAGLLAAALIALLDYGTDARLSISVLYFLPVAACAWCGGFSPGALVALSGAVAWHMVDGFENPALPPAFRVWNGVLRFGTLIMMCSLVARLRVSILRERLLARTDSLTGAANGRTFYETAVGEAERARRTSRPLTLAYFDLDDFKLLNDRLGHAAGDEALRCVVDTIQLHLRNADLLARLGGDEFALLMPETGADGAVALLSRLQEYLARELTRKNWPVTLSVGAVTFLRPLADIDVMIQRVDALMYNAKRQGKGRVEHAIVSGDEDAAPPIDRRATARALTNRPARVRREGQEGDEGFATVRDVSVAGICLHLENALPEGTVLLVDPLAPGARPLLARVVHAVAEESGGYRHGCELSTRLSVQEFRLWVGESAPTVERDGAPSPVIA